MVKVALMIVICAIVAVYLGITYKHACQAVKKMKPMKEVPKGMQMAQSTSISEGWIKLEGVFMG